MDSLQEFLQFPRKEPLVGVGTLLLFSNEVCFDPRGSKLRTKSRTWRA
jgi:hypothetical protein